MFCNQCGAKLTVTANFCGGCGAKQSSVKLMASQSLSVSDAASSSNLIARVRGARVRGDHLVPDLSVRTMFVVAAKTSMDEEKWLLAKYPSSKVIRYSTTGAVRSRVVQAVKAKQVDSLTIIGTAVSIPPCRLHDDQEADIYKEYQGVEKYRPVESDSYYTLEHLPISQLPTQKVVYTNVAFASRVARLGHTAMMGEIPVGRIPFDDFSQCQQYFEQIDNCLTPSEKTWWAISEDSDDWAWECRAILNQLQVNHRLDRVDGNDIHFRELLTRLNQLPEGTRLLLNLHGSLPSKEPSSQIFTPDLSHNAHQKLDLSLVDDATNCILFLFACYGGNSKYWQSFGAIPHFLSVGGLGVVAASTQVWCTQESDIPGEIAPGAAHIAYEFLSMISEGVSLGEALIAAKANTLLKAFSIEEPWFICKTIKEVIQFSLYGAPWVCLEPKSLSVSSGASKGGSLIDQVRSGRGVASNLQKSVVGGLLSEVSSRLLESLGDGADFFVLSRQHALQRFVVNPAFNSWKNQVEQDGFSFEEGLFEAFVLGNNVLNIVTLPSSNHEQELMVILDETGNLIKSLEAKGK